MLALACPLPFALCPCHQDGADELGVLLYGHARNAYWFGSRLTIAHTAAAAPHQNATGMQARRLLCCV
jgi:homospermidine synthase